MNAIKGKRNILFAAIAAAVVLAAGVMGVIDTAAEQTKAAEADGEKQAITGFEELSGEQTAVRVESGTSLDEITSGLPDTIEVYLEGQSEPVAIPVSWECVGDYENSSYYYYELDPVWDTEAYEVSDVTGSIPYIGVFIGGESSLKGSSLSENQEAIYDFMTTEMGFNAAAACGVLANLQCESSFRPTASVIDTNGLTSYGICQWNGSRFEALKTYCSEHNYDYQTLEGQLYYLKYELEHSEASACSMVKNVDDTSEGAYLAGYNWARYFERCSSAYYESRAKLARDTYWPIYGSGQERIKYTIEYELDGGVNDSENPESYYNTSGTITLNDPTKTGYIFGGWYTSRSMKTKVTSVSGSDGKNLTLYAKWTPITYTIEFNGNKATSGKMSSMTNCKYDTVYTLAASKFKKTGYRFAGWNTKKDGSGTSYSNKTNLSNLTKKDGKTIVLYAQWSKRNYTITYKLGGGEQADGNPDTYTVSSKTITLENPTKKGYQFLGWYSDSSYQTKVTKIKKGSTGNLTLYAKWQRNQYNIVFDGNGATSGTMDTGITCKYGKSYTLPANKFKKTNYVFTGWNTKADGSGESYEDEEKVKNITAKNNKTVTLYAQWSKNAYRIQYVLNGGIITEENPSQYYSDTKTFQLNEPEREGYTFEGWYTESSFRNKITSIKKGTKKNLKLYAKWKANEYAIEFDGNGADLGTTAALTDCKYGETYTLTANGFEKSGSDFMGWNTERDGSGVFYSDRAEISNLSTEDKDTIVLYAQWE